MSMKPMLFKSGMVRAILEDRKTMTRQVVKPQPRNRLVPMPIDSCWPGYFGEWGASRVIDPPYRPGDILYVRETWAKISDWTNVDPSVGLPDGYIYKADWDDSVEHPKWHTCVHMPREAARIFLRVTDLRVERLQDITEEQSQLEGIEKRLVECINASDVFEFVIPGTNKVSPSAHGAFKHFWERTIKPADRVLYGWDANPWVWVVEFEKISRMEAERENHQSKL